MISKFGKVCSTLILPLLEKFGITDRFVLQAADDPNNVTVVGEGELGKIQGLLSSEDLKSALRNAGISGPVTIFVGENKL